MSFAIAARSLFFTLGRAKNSAFLRGIVATFATKGLAAAIGLISSIIVARALGPEGRGAFIAAGTLASVGVQIANLGLHSANTYWLARDIKVLPTIVANSAAVSLMAGGTVVLIFGLGSAAGLLADLELPLLGLALLSIPIGVAYSLLLPVLVVLHAVSRFNQIEIGLRAGTVLLSLVLIWLHHVSPASMLLASILVQLLALVAVWLVIGQPLAALAQWSSELLQQQIPFAVRSYLGCFFAFLVLRSDILIVQHLRGNAETGYYSIAVSMADALYMLPAAVGLLLFPRLSAISDSDLRREETWRLLWATGAAMCALGLVAALLARPFIANLFGPDFLPALPMFFVLAAGMVAYGMNGVVSNHLAAEGAPWISVWIWAAGLAVNVGLNLATVPSSGGLGAALSSLAAYALVLIAQIYIVFYRKVHHP
jgi:enterobacterial common antigen flippase